MIRELANIEFCIHCNRKTEYEYRLRRVEDCRNGFYFSYIEIATRCKECGSEVYVPEINDANVDARLDAYRKEVYLNSINWDEIPLKMKLFEPLDAPSADESIEHLNFMKGRFDGKKAWQTWN